MSRPTLEELESRFLLSGVVGPLPLDDTPTAAVRTIQWSVISTPSGQSGGRNLGTGDSAVVRYQPTVLVSGAPQDGTGPVWITVTQDARGPGWTSETKRVVGPISIGESQDVVVPISMGETQVYVSLRARPLPAPEPIQLGSVDVDPDAAPAAADPPTQGHSNLPDLGEVALAYLSPAGSADVADVGNLPALTPANSPLIRPAAENVKAVYDVDGFRGSSASPHTGLALNPAEAAASAPDYWSNPQAPAPDEAEGLPAAEPAKKEADGPEFLQALGQMAEQAASLPVADLPGLQRALDDLLAQLGRFGTDVDVLFDDRTRLWIYSVLSAVAAVAACEISRRQQRKVPDSLALEALRLSSLLPHQDLRELP